MQRALYLADGRGLYRENASMSAAVAYLWPFSRAYLGTLCLAGMPGRLGAFAPAVDDRARALEHYWAGVAYASAVIPPGGDLYYDDNAWVGLSLVLQYRLGLAGDLRRAQQLWTFARGGWDRNGRDPRPGGVFWVQQGFGYGLRNHDRGAGATAGSAELGFVIAERSQAAIDDATRMVDWVAAHLDRSGTGSGPFENVVRKDGSIDDNLWSYNQGVMLGARALQYRLSGNASFLQTAESIARQTLTTFGNFQQHPPSFNAMCFQNMLMLHPASTDLDLKAQMLAAMRAYGDWAWASARASDGLFHFDDGGRPALGLPAKVQDQGAMTQLYALLAWDPASYGRLT
jgi:Glycosyl hydrolase family 76